MVEDGLKVVFVGEETCLFSADSSTPVPNPASKEQSRVGVCTLVYYALRLFLNGSYNYTQSVGSAPASSLPASVAKAMVISQPSSHLVYQKHFPSLTSIPHPLWVSLPLPTGPPVLAEPPSEVPGTLS